MGRVLRCFRTKYLAENIMSTAYIHKTKLGCLEQFLKQYIITFITVSWQYITKIQKKNYASNKALTVIHCLKGLIHSCPEALVAAPTGVASGRLQTLLPLLVQHRLEALQAARLVQPEGGAHLCVGLLAAISLCGWDGMVGTVRRIARPLKI